MHLDEIISGDHVYDLLAYLRDYKLDREALGWYARWARSINRPRMAGILENPERVEAFWAASGGIYEAMQHFEEAQRQADRAASKLTAEEDREAQRRIEALSSPRKGKVSGPAVRQAVEAALKGHTKLVRSFIADGGDVDARADTTDHPEQRTLLMAASAGGHADVVELLLENGAGVDVEDAAGETAMAHAIGAAALAEAEPGPSSPPRGVVEPSRRYLAVARLLLRAGAKIVGAAGAGAGDGARARPCPPDMDELLRAHATSRQLIAERRGRRPSSPTSNDDPTASVAMTAARLVERTAEMRLRRAFDVRALRARALRPAAAHSHAALPTPPTSHLSVPRRVRSASLTRSSRRSRTRVRCSATRPTTSSAMRTCCATTSCRCQPYQHSPRATAVAYV